MQCKKILSRIYPGKIRVCWNGVDTQKCDARKVGDGERLAIRRKYQIEDDDKMLLFILSEYPAALLRRINYRY
jgi:hypothetical protein